MNDLESYLIKNINESTKKPLREADEPTTWLRYIEKLTKNVDAMYKGFQANKEYFEHAYTRHEVQRVDKLIDELYDALNDLGAAQELWIHDKSMGEA